MLLSYFDWKRYFTPFLKGRLSVATYALIGCLVFYAFQGSPTPDQPSIVELIIAGLLIVSMVGGGVIKTILNSHRDYKEHLIFLLFGLSIPVIVGVIQGESLFIMGRDIVAFLFLCLPIFFLYRLKNNSHFFSALFMGCAVIAIIFSVRVFFPHVPLTKNTGELLYLANSPIVLFFAIYFICSAYQKLFNHNGMQKFILFTVLLGASSLILLAMIQDIQRATLLAVFISLGYIIVESLIKRPVRSVIPLLLTLALIVYSFPIFETMVSAIVHKTSLVGFNARSQELTAVWEEIGHSPVSVLFGTGWGSQFESPALGGLKASFTHSFLSYMLLKTGLIGFGITLMYCAFFLKHIYSVFLNNRVVGIALFWSFVIPIFLYASYKSFDFGLLLTLIMACSLYSTNNEKTLNSDY